MSRQVYPGGARVHRTRQHPWYVRIPAGRTSGWSTRLSYYSYIRALVDPLVTVCARRRRALQAEERHARAGARACRDVAPPPQVLQDLWLLGEDAARQVARAAARATCAGAAAPARCARCARTSSRCSSGRYSYWRLPLRVRRTSGRMIVRVHAHDHAACTPRKLCACHAHNLSVRVLMSILSWPR